MKFTTILLTAAFLQVNATGFSQVVTLSGKNIPLKQLFSVVKKQTGYQFFANRDDLANANTVSVDVANMPLGEFVTLVLKDQPLNYLIKGNTIVLSRKAADPVSAVAAPAVTVRGVVTDEEGKPMKGVTVQNGTYGTQTGDNGAFELGNVNTGAVLSFSFVGYVTQTHKVSSINNAIVIKMVRQVQSLTEMVMVGYGSSRRKDLTGSVASVDVNEVKNTPFVSIDQALAGKAAGVQVMQADGSPGGMARIRIRGGASLIGGNDPLYIIDGVQVPIQNRYVQAAADLVNPVERLGNDANYMSTSVGSSYARGLNTLAGLNINDIESIDILKDASATAIYGSRAANGVVIITTKKGRRMKNRCWKPTTMPA
ncbi:TonB-dependent receptor plug domain-containing protein [Chitinophaga sedimenti]|uniref:SusC/RagA family TonB-linked outer membrane protein n=1 Tax=Chitinophaga sedimenti TaxID=2033606 RepID=UPI002002BEE0|nr:STN domain-containing protein [Chitinophaga sedimenti]MCK7555654.1 TonB-dependent receptor plug domain-containing protein [Chitinophaga sedimenti]